MNKAKIENKFYIIVIDTGEEIEVSESVYAKLGADFQAGKVGAQVLFKDIRGKKYMEQRHNIRMREKTETTY